MTFHSVQLQPLKLHPEAVQQQPQQIPWKLIEHKTMEVLLQIIQAQAKV
jgi:hypothetical protein